MDIETQTSIERPVFELRVVNDHVLKIEALYKSLTPDLQPAFLDISQALPPVLFSCSSEEKLLFVRTYILLRQATDEPHLGRFMRAVSRANASISAPAPARPGSGSWNDRMAFWQSANLREWADSFEAAAAEDVGK